MIYEYHNNQLCTFASFNVILLNEFDGKLVDSNMKYRMVNRQVLEE